MARIGEGYDNTIPDSTTQAASTWVGYVDAFVEDAIERLTSVVPASNLEFTADVDVNSQSLTGLNSVQLSQTDLSATSVGYLYRNASNDDLYYKNGSTDIRITSGSGVNVSGTGTISGGGSINYTGTGNYFKLEDSLGGTTANLNCADLQLDNDAESYKLSLTWNGAANQTITMPASNPGATSIMTMTAAGEIVNTTSIPSFSATTATLTNPPAHTSGWIYKIPVDPFSGTTFGNTSYYPFAPQVGDTLTTVAVNRVNSTAGGTITTSVIKITAGTISVLATASNTASTTQGTVTFSSLTEVVSSDSSVTYAVRVVNSAGGTHFVNAAQYTCTR